RLDVLPPDEALTLLRGIVAAKGTDAELREVAKLCGRLPLALRVAGDFLRLHENWKVPEHVAALKDEAERLERVEGKTAERGGGGGAGVERPGSGARDPGVGRAVANARGLPRRLRPASRRRSVGPEKGRGAGQGHGDGRTDRPARPQPRAIRRGHRPLLAARP